MAQWQMRSKRKPTGRHLKANSKKKKYQRGRDWVPMHIGKEKRSKLRTKGGGEKLALFGGNVANIMVDGIAKKATITTVLDNKADSQYVRRNIITKGAVIQTDLGKARVTSRVGQDGVLNAVLIEEKK